MIFRQNTGDQLLATRAGPRGFFVRMAMGRRSQMTDPTSEGSAMSHGPQLHLAAASLHTHSSAASTTPDTLMMFGFFAAVMLLGSFAIHEKSARLLAIRTICLCALALYGFAEGVWPLAMAVAFLCVRESIRLRASIPGRWSVAATKPRGNALFAPEIRLAASLRIR